MKAIATAVVSLLRNGTAPVLPKNVWLLPPNAAPRSDPFPDCKRIDNINPMQINTWRITSNVVIVLSYRISLGSYISYQKDNSILILFIFKINMVSIPK